MIVQFTLDFPTAKQLSEKNIINVLHAAQIADADWERIGMQLIESRAL